MKKIIALILLLAVCVVYAATETHTTGTANVSSAHHQSTATNYGMMKKAAIVMSAGELDGTVTEAIDSIHGIVMRISIDVTGTDGDYTVTLRDENDITIFSAANLDSDPTADFSYAVYEDDTEGNPWAGVPVGGVMDLVVTDAADLTAMTVSIYYLDFWR